MARQQIEAAFAMLDVELGRHGQRASIHLVRGAVMGLVFRSREATRDVDGWFDEPSLPMTVLLAILSTRDAIAQHDRGRCAW